MNDYFASKRNDLDESFRTTLQDMMTIYADSKIKDDGRISVKMEELKTIMGSMTNLREEILKEVRETNKSITRMSARVNDEAALKNELDESDADNMVLTADQQMNDAKSLFDQHRILLLIKVGIVLLILVKGNEIYESYRLVFAGASLACIFVYMLFVLFF